MALKTVNITGKLYNPDGTPAANATGTAVLTRLEVDDGTVVPSVVSFTTDAAGLLDINLWPNERGQAGSRYRLRAKTAKNGIVDTMITVPDSDVPVSLDDVIEAVPYPPVEYSKKILEQAQTAVDTATDKANIASTAATTANQKADAAALSEDSANASKLAAKQSEDNAKESEDNAAISLQTAQDIVIGLSAYAIPGQVVKTTPGGQVTYLFRQPAFNLEDVAPGGELGTGLHPAFIFNGIPEREIFVGAYPAAMVNGEIVCQPGRDPRASRNFDQSRAECQALGAGWDIMSNWDWSAVALWCMANGFQPRGNTNYGQHHANRWETGTRVVDDIPGSSTNTNGRTLTGSGPAGWSHNNTPGGIHDLVGNVWEWNQGLVLDNNMFKIAPDNGTYLESEFIDTAYAAAANGTFSTRSYTDPPLILKQGLVVPASASLAPTGYFYKNAEGMRFASRGGSFNSGSAGGPGALNCGSSRTGAGTNFGFRPRFRNL